jgi:DNA-binding transcriptional regulator YiaG
MKSLPATLRRWRRARGLSQSQAAPVLGVALATLQNWEQGHRTPRGLALEFLRSKLETRNSK